MIVKIYCGRPGCGKLIGARDFSPQGKVLEEEFEPGVVTFHDDSGDEADWDGIKFCSQECCDKRHIFIEPEEIEDE